jgi:hypothetical protein
MDTNHHFFLGFAEAVDALMVFRMSFLMDASNFRVGTVFNSSLRPFSIRGVL